MGENDVAAILRAMSEFQTSITKHFDNRISGVFAEISKVCSRVEVLETDKVQRDTRECVEKEEKGKHINWTSVRQGAAIVASGALTLAAIKILLANIDKIVK